METNEKQMWLVIGMIVLFILIAGGDLLISPKAGS